MMFPRRWNPDPRRMAQRFRQSLDVSSAGQFIRDVGLLIWEYKWYSLVIFVVTIVQEWASIVPVNLLGDFIDAIDTGGVSRIVWLFFGASLLYPALLRANTVLRHKMFYDSDLEKRVELLIKLSDAGICRDTDKAAAAHTRVINAVSGVTNTAYHLLGSFTPVIIKTVIVSGNLLRMNRLLGWVYLSTLVVPAVMTVIFNKKLVVLRDSQYSVIGEASGVGIETIQHKEDPSIRERLKRILHERRDIMMSLLIKSQSYLYIRQSALIVSQFAAVFLALAIRDRVGITAGDFAKIIGYTTQVAAAFITAAAQLDSIISYSRAYHVYAMGNIPPAAQTPAAQTPAAETQQDQTQAKP